MGVPGKAVITIAGRSSKSTGEPVSDRSASLISSGCMRKMSDSVGMRSVDARVDYRESDTRTVEPLCPRRGSADLRRTSIEHRPDPPVEPDSPLRGSGAGADGAQQLALLRQIRFRQRQRRRADAAELSRGRHTQRTRAPHRGFARGDDERQRGRRFVIIAFDDELGNVEERRIDRRVACDIGRNHVQVPVPLGTVERDGPALSARRRLNRGGLRPVGGDRIENAVTGDERHRVRLATLRMGCGNAGAIVVPTATEDRARDPDTERPPAHPPPPTPNRGLEKLSRGRSGARRVGSATLRTSSTHASRV